MAHDNSLRALLMYLEIISPQDIAKLNIPTGTPRSYVLMKIRNYCNLIMCKIMFMVLREEVATQKIDAMVTSNIFSKSKQLFRVLA